jgi:hypothetical protein
MNRTRMAINNLFGLIPPPITIQIHPEHFHFSMGNESLQLETRLNLQMVKGKYEVHSAGETSFATSDIIRIDLFRNSDMPGGRDRMEILEAYLRYAIQKLVRRSRIIRPLVHVIGAHTLDELLMGYQYFLLRTVLMGAGAREVRFD